MSPGLGWATPLAQRPLAGFSHGAAGIAWALIKLAALTGEPRFHDAASQALAYERKLFSEEAQNWPDLREEANTPSYTTAWCHGATGIGLARLATLPYLDTPEIRKEIRVAVHTTIQAGFGHNHSLCHGDMGNLELLLQANCTLAIPQMQAPVARNASMVLKSIGEYGYLCGVPLGVENPGLMAGLAGIGYGLLRLAEPAAIPSVLVLDPPY
jgi:lantibiotic modifying enzyme